MTLFLALTFLGAELQSQPANVNSEMTFGEKFAPWASLIYPGTGELLRGYKLKGEILMWADGLAVTSMLGFTWDAANKRNVSRQMAVMDAGANPSNPNEKYYSKMEEFLSSDLYNQSLAIKARKAYPKDLPAQKAYIAARAYVGDDAWVWKSDSAKVRYLRQRTAMRNSEGTSNIIFGVMVLTRIISVFDVAFFSPPTESPRLGLEPVVDPNAPGLKLTYHFGK